MHFQNCRSYCANLDEQYVPSNSQQNIFQRMQDCLRQRRFTQYSAKVERIKVKFDPKPYTNSSKNVHFNIYPASNTKNVYEEVLIFDEIGLVGTIGGSLGLFVGFSFLGFINPCMEALIDKMNSLTPS